MCSQWEDTFVSCPRLSSSYARDVDVPNAHGPADLFEGGAVSGDSHKIKPTLVDIRCRTTAAILFAELYAGSHPQHAKALDHFMREIRKIVQELGEAVYGKPIAG